jgi:flavin-binding protein dodecin
MSVARTTEISAAGPTIEEAIRNGVERSSRTLDNVEGVWVKNIKAKIDGGRIAEYRVDMKVTFVLDD